jgi:c-di-GMP-related signal transduction protein
MGLDPRQQTCVARQPIFDRTGRRVHGYELLYRATPQDTACETSTDCAAARTVTDAMLALGLDVLTSGRPAFLNLTRTMLLGEIDALLPPASTVLELREDIAADDEVIEACRRLRHRRFALALDDFEPGGAAEGLIPHVQFVKVDVRRTRPPERGATARRLGKGVTLVAEKVESHEEFDATRDEGYTLFQGSFFCMPRTIARRALPASRLVYLQLLTKLNQPDIGVGDLEDIIKRDVSLSYRVLRSVNSARFGIGRPIESVRQAIVLLGVGQIRAWASVWSIAGLADQESQEIGAMSLIRARCCEWLGEQLHDGEPGSLFLLGLCSLLDVMLDTPMTAALAELPLAPRIRAALVGRPNDARALLDITVAFESGRWADARKLAEAQRLDPDLLPAAYAEALRWARELQVGALALAG